MFRSVCSATIVLLLGLGVAWAADQSDEPKPTEPAHERAGVVDVGIYAAAGKALRFYDMSRLNSALSGAGVSPFTGMVDDWNFELMCVSPRSTLFGAAGAFWSEHTGGSPARAKTSGWEIEFRYGIATLPTSLAQLFPTLGIGYAARNLSTWGNLSGLNISQIPRRGSANLREQGMLLEAGVRVDLMSAWPRATRAAFLAVQSLTVGWQGVPVSSGWLSGGTRVGLPDAFANALFVRFNLGFGGGVRRNPPSE